jgi:hypothetical protein
MMHKYRRKFYFAIVVILAGMLSSCNIQAETWIQVNEDGFGDSNNFAGWVPLFLNSGDDLYTGTLKKYYGRTASA